MNNDEKYRAWKERPSPRDVSADFSADVMRRIYRQAEQQQTEQNEECFHGIPAQPGRLRFYRNSGWLACPFEDSAQARAPSRRQGVTDHSRSSRNGSAS